MRGRALTPPGYRKEYHIAVRNAKTGKLLGFISGTPQTVHIRDKSVKMVDVPPLEGLQRR